MLKKRYADDINMDKLETQLYLFPGIAEGKNYSAADRNIMDIIKLMQSLTPAERDFITEVMYIEKLILLAPATNAVSKRSFSSLKWFKNIHALNNGRQPTRTSYGFAHSQGFNG